VRVSVIVPDEISRQPSDVHERLQLPLRRADWDAYLKWAVDSFKLATAGVSDTLQTHSHFCYSDFDDIFPSIQRLDADVISIEASKSDMKLLKTFKQYGYSNQIGPGVYDIHSPRVPSVQEIQDRIKDMLAILPESLLFVNPVRISHSVFDHTYFNLIDC
jgi:5-methyltetrahydropteroyltriglutamate--homocysteine methyltransferase